MRQAHLGMVEEDHRERRLACLVDDEGLVDDEDLVMLQARLQFK